MSKRVLLSILMVISMVAWGESWVSAKILNRYLDANELIFWRFFFTSLGMVLVLIFFKISLKESLRELFIAFIGGIILSCYNYFFFLGTKYGLASFGGIFVTTINPIVTFLLIALISKNNLRKDEIFGLLLGFLGAIIMLRLWREDIFIEGNVYFLLAALTWPILTLVSSKHKMKSAILFSFYMFVFTTLIDLVILEFNLTNIFKFDSKFWLNLLLLSFFGTTFATTTYFLAVVKLGSKVASSFFFMVPLSSFIFAIIFLKERVDIALLIGGAISLVAVYFLNYIKKRES